MISYNLHNPSKSLADRIYTAEFDDALVDQIAWKNIRYEGCKVKTKTLNKYTPKEVASNNTTGIGFAYISQPGIGIAGPDGIGGGMAIGATGPSCFTVGGYYSNSSSPPHPSSNTPGVFQINNFIPKVLWEGDTLNPRGTVSNLKHETVALYLASTVIGGEDEDPQFAYIKGHSYLNIDKILLINPRTDQVQIIEKHAENFLPFHQFVTNDLPTGGSFTLRLVEEGISHALKGTDRYKVKMNKGWLLKSFSFKYDEDAPQLTENNSLYLYKGGTKEEGFITYDGFDNSANVDEVAQDDRVRFRYGVIEMFNKAASAYTGPGHYLQRENIGPSFINSHIIENKFTIQYYSGSFGGVSEPPQPAGTHNKDIVATSGLGSASRFIGQNSLTFLRDNNNDVSLTEQEKTELHITFFQGSKDFAPGANDERSISTFEVDKNQEQLGIGDVCHDFLPKNHEIILKGHRDTRFEPQFPNVTSQTYVDTFQNAYVQEDTVQVNGCVQVNQQLPTTQNTEIQLGINIDRIANAGIYVQGGAIGEVGYVGAQSASDTTSYGFSNLTHTSGPLSGSVSASNHFYSGSFSYELSWLDKDHVIITNLDKDAELFNGAGSQGIIIIPEHIHPKITSNMNFYLQQAGIGSGNAPNTITKLDNLEK
jgi:hypothetical protein